MVDKSLLFGIRLTIAVLLLGGCFCDMAQADKKKEHIPMAARMALKKAGELMDRQAFDQAIKVLTEFQARGPAQIPDNPGPKGYHHPMVYFYLGNCHLMCGHFAKAEAALAKAVARAPDMTAAWQNLAKAHYEQAHYEAAARCFLTTYERSDRSNGENLCFSALSDSLAGRHAAAISAFQRLFDNHPGQITLTWKAYFAQALLAADQSRRALPLLRDLATQSPVKTRAKWQEILLYQYIQLDMHAEALAYATHLTRSQSTTAKWWKALAHVQLSDGCTKKALVALTIYSYLTPLSAEEKRLLADLNLQLDLPRQAVRRYLELLDDHADESALRNLIIACQRLEQYGEALAYLARFGADTQSTDLLMLKADLYYALKDFGDAQAAYHRVAEQKGSRAAQAWLMAGYAAWQQNDLEAGRQAFQAAAKDRHHRKAALSATRQMESSVSR